MKDLAQFLAEYDADSDIWWNLSPGEMQNWFELLRDDYLECWSLLRDLVESVTTDCEGDSVYTYADSAVVEQAEKWFSLRGEPVVSN